MLAIGTCCSASVRSPALADAPGCGRAHDRPFQAACVVRPAAFHPRPGAALPTRRGRLPAASSDPPPNLDRAATAFAKGVQQGTDEDDAVAQQLGAATAAQLTEVQEKYKQKVKDALAQRAAELQREKEERAVTFYQGQQAYGRGAYPQAVTLLESALNEEGPFSVTGGEVQLWLALAYAACGREEDCIETYKYLENTHPSTSIRRRAGELRYIMEAPKLELSPDEKVQIPLLTDLEANRGKKQPDRPRAPTARAKPREKTWDEEFWEGYRPPVYLQNRYVVAAAVTVAAGLAWYSSTLAP